MVADLNIISIHWTVFGYTIVTTLIKISSHFIMFKSFKGKKQKKNDFVEDDVPRLCQTVDINSSFRIFFDLILSFLALFTPMFFVGLPRKTR